MGFLGQWPIREQLRVVVFACRQETLVYFYISWNEKIGKIMLVKI